MKKAMPALTIFLLVFFATHTGFAALALSAFNVAYKQDIVYSGPIYDTSYIDENKIVISFSQKGSGLVAIDGESLSEFAIAGIDKKFVWANAKIEAGKVIVWSDEITEPRYVRYAWADNR